MTEERLASIERRLLAVEAIAHPPIDLTAIVGERAEIVAKCIESDPHVFGTRPCQTCRVVSSVLGRPFGCVARLAARVP